MSGISVDPNFFDMLTKLINNLEHRMSELPSMSGLTFRIHRILDDIESL